MSTTPSPAAPSATGAWRIERDSMGELQVPAHALYRAQTQRALQNFDIGGHALPQAFLVALLRIKQAAARANVALRVLEPSIGDAIAQACEELLHEPAALPQHFPIDVYQTGSGTSTNMNANEVLATLASRRLRQPVHPNDHVNASQSSNDTIPSALHASAALALHHELVPALEHLATTIATKADAVGHHLKTGRTHLMDALPVRLGQVLGGWEQQVRDDIERLRHLLPQLLRLPQGGTAVGTGVNAPSGFAPACCAELARLTGLPFEPAHDRFALMGAQDTAVALSGLLKCTAVTLMKLANDLRWMNSGPLAGLAEIELPALQPGSSIMPGKVNPVIPEAVAMAAAQVIGHDAAVTVAGQSGNFELNVMLPLIAHDVLASLGLLSRSARALADRAIAGFTVNEARLREALARNPILATALNPRIGYMKAAEIARQAYAQDRPVLEVAVERSGLPRDQLEALLDPASLADPGGARTPG